MHCGLLPFVMPPPSLFRLRALSGGGGSSSVASPPLSPALPKYKLADYRYGREEMLALYIKDNKVRDLVIQHGCSVCVLL